MSYAVVWGPEAEDDYAKLPPLVQSRLLDEIDRLVADPVRLSIPSHFPYRPDRQLFRVTVEDENDQTFYLYVLFKYLSDESSIYISEIASQVTE
jgi:mRNA-degrading endonuclease RelE of RelBE toxin-antitoxin system